MLNNTSYKTWISILKLILIGSLLVTSVYAQNVVFPDDAGVIDVTEEPYFAKGDGVIDDTKAIQRALDDYPNGNRIIYLPNGTYLISSTLKWPPSNSVSGSIDQKRTALEGQSRDSTIIKLKDHLHFNKAMIWTGDAPAQRFFNEIRWITVNTGEGNPEAIGIQFHSNNWGGMKGVKIVAGDRKGAIGLDMSYTNEIGPLYIRDLHIIGYDIGIATSGLANGQTFENITLEHQNEVGILNNGQVIEIYMLTSHNTVPAIINAPFNSELASMSVLTLIDATLTCDSSDQPSIINNGTLYSRNVTSKGYKRTIQNNNGNKKDVNCSSIIEFGSHDVIKMFDDSPSSSLNLPIKDTPEIPWDNLAEWVNVVDYGAGKGGDDTQAFQAAIDAGKTTIYVPAGFNFTINGVVELRGNVRRLIGTRGNITGTGKIRFGEGSQPVVVIEQFRDIVPIEHASSRTLIIESCATVAKSNGTGDFFINDVCGSGWEFNNPAQHIWIRQINPEGDDKHNIINNGATLWILGLKTEKAMVKILTQNEGRTEVLGAHIYSQGKPKTTPLFQIVNASASFAGVRQYDWHAPGDQRYFHDYVEEIRNGEKRILKMENTPDKILPLYAGFKPKEK